MVAEPTWIAPEPTAAGRLDGAERRALRDSAFAFPARRKEPPIDASHARDDRRAFSRH